MGAELEAFEDEFAAYCGTDHAVGVSTGTEAISLALRALEHRPRRRGDRPGQLVHRHRRGRQLGRRDAEARSTSTRETHLITPEAVEAAIGPRTRCVIPVHLMGSTVDVDRDPRGRPRRPACA